MFNNLTGQNNVNLGYLGVLLAAIGLAICLVVIIPHAIKQYKRDGIWPIRLCLVLLPAVILYTFSFAFYTTINNMFLDGKIGSETANLYRLHVGTGVGAMGLLLLIMFKFGGTLKLPKE